MRLILVWAVCLIYTLAGAQEVIRDHDGKVIQIEHSDVLQAPSDDPVLAADLFLKSHEEQLGISDIYRTLTPLKQHAKDVIRYQQTFEGVPFLGARYSVYFDTKAQAFLAKGKLARRTELSSMPTVSKLQAQKIATQRLQQAYGILTSPSLTSDLYFLDPEVSAEYRQKDVTLAWILRSYEFLPNKSHEVLVDAHTGSVIYDAPIARGITRRIYDCSYATYLTQGGAVLGNNLPAKSICSRGFTEFTPLGFYTFGSNDEQTPQVPNPYHPESPNDPLAAFLLAQEMADLMQTKFNRNAANGSGGYGVLGSGDSPYHNIYVYLEDATPYIESSFQLNCPYNAKGGVSMQFCGGSVTEDLFAHEYAHGLIYSLYRDINGVQQGFAYEGETAALEESFADLIATAYEYDVNADLSDEDNNHWLMGETDTFAGFRSQSNPESFQGPRGRTSANRYYSDLFPCNDQEDPENFYVKAGVVNKASYLMSQGGEFNECTINGIGIDKTLQVFYKAWSEFFTRNEDFNQAYLSLTAACALLAEGNQFNITSADCAEVRAALQAVEMDQPGRCSGVPRQTPACAPPVDTDSDGIIDSEDLCPKDASKATPGLCGCGVPDTDSDLDGAPDCVDSCQSDPGKQEPGACGCGTPDSDQDGDTTLDCQDLCITDPSKTEPGQCGCGLSDVDSDNDGVADCNELCPNDPLKTAPGSCGCGLADVDSDNDGVADCNEQCPNDPLKTAPGSCGCGLADVDSDNDGVADCNELCPNDADKTTPGVCGCGIPDTDLDGNGVPDCQDTQSDVCQDSDDRDYFSAGTVTYKGREYSDTCARGGKSKVLKENYCKVRRGKSRRRVTRRVCINGCNNGACNPE